MRALEDLVNDVRDARSRDRLAEAVRAYQAGALRPAIIATWVAVALDLVTKVRDLADLGEPVAIAYVKALDQAIEAQNPKALTVLERGLLDKCRDEFELIAGREHTELSRLHEDRHVCAHPGFVSPDVVFDPTPELCRSHIATAVDAVLRHGPTPGRKAIDRFISEARGTSWPETRAALANHLRASYIERGKAALRRNLVIVILKGCLDEDDDAFARRLAEAARALETIDPGLLDQGLDAVVTRREQTSGLSDLQLLRFVGRLGDLGGAWRGLPTTSHPRVLAALKAADVADLLAVRALSVAVPQAEVASALQGRLDELDAETLATVIATGPAPPLVAHAIAKLSESGGWRTGESRMNDLILPLASHLDLEQLRAVHEVLKENDQVRRASGMPPLMLTLLNKTVTIPGAIRAWREISDWLKAQGRDDDPNDWYAYPQLARVIAELEARPIP
jgi:hypothetical protein